MQSVCDGPAESSKALVVSLLAAMSFKLSPGLTTALILGRCVGALGKSHAAA